MNTAEKIAFWHRQYDNMKKRLEAVRRGEKINPDTIRSYQVGVEQEAIEEANHAADKLKELNIIVQKVT